MGEHLPSICNLKYYAGKSSVCNTWVPHRSSHLFSIFPCVFFHWTLLGPHLFTRPLGLEENRTISTDYQEASRLFCYFISASIGSLTAEHKTNKADEMNQCTQSTVSSTCSLASKRENYQLPRAQLLSLGVPHSTADERLSKGPGWAALHTII